MTNTINGMDGAQQLLMKLVEQNPDDWATRKKVAKVLFDAGFYRDASIMIWNAPEIPPIGEEVIYAARIVSKGQPTRAMRLFDTVIEKNRHHPDENLAMARLLLRAGMPHQALRFYGAATVLDPELIDEKFELAIVHADTESISWAEYVATDEFPWEGPVPENDQAEDEVKSDPYADLLSGATLPVPMKAPVREHVDLSKGYEETKSQPVTERKNELPTWRVEKKKTSYFSPEMNEREKGLNGGVHGDTNGIPANSPVNRMGEAATVATQESKPEEKPKVNGDAANGAESKSANGGVNHTKPLAELRVEEKNETEQKSVEAEQSTKVEEPAKEPVEAKDTIKEEKPDLDSKTEPEAKEEKQEPKAEEPKAGAFFKSHADDQQDKPVAEKVAEKEEKQEDQKTPATEPVAKSEPVAKPEPEAKKVEPIEAKENKPEDKAKPVEDVRSDTEATGGDDGDKKKGIFSGALSSLVSKMRRKPDEEREPVINVDELDLSGVKPTATSEAANGPVKNKSGAVSVQQPSAATNAQAPASTMPGVKTVASIAPNAVRAVSPVPVPAMQTTAVAEEPATASAPEQAGVPMPSAVKAVKKLEPEQPSVPQELDGRTQLVSLAPEDGTTFFDQLKARYRAVQADALPQAAVVARDLANVDYIDLVNRACEKDLTAFSKLLGLHKVMHNAGCIEWVEDMNMLRKGYGDAVLATVVSKYSVSECREILNRVYSHPQPQTV